MVDRALVIFAAILVCVIIITIPSVTIYGGVQANKGQSKLDATYPVGSLIKIRGSQNEYVIIKNEYQWFVNSERSETTIVDPKAGVRIKVNSSDLVSPMEEKLND